MIINHLQVRPGMILQVGPWGHSVDLPKNEPPNLQEVGPSNGTSSSMDGRLQCHSISGASGPMVQREETHGTNDRELSSLKLTASLQFTPENGWLEDETSFLEGRVLWNFVSFWGG